MMSHTSTDEPRTLGQLGDATADRPAFTPKVIERFDYRGYTVEVRETGKPHARYSAWFKCDSGVAWEKVPVNSLSPTSAAETGRKQVDFAIEGLSG